MFPTPPRPPLPAPSVMPPIHVPVGSVIAYMGDATSQAAALASAGWLICDGAPLSASMYPELYAVIRNIYGPNPPEEGTFSLPDLRGYFLRGLDTAGTVDKDGKGRTVGSQEPCALQEHVHTYAQAVTVTAVAGDQANGSVTTQQSDTGDVVVTNGTPGVSENETRPVNVAVYYLIKYSTGAWPWPPSFGPLVPASGG